MAIKLEATYSKKLGLPNYSSHCYVVSLSTELTDLSQVETESARLYALIQHTVDRELQETGFVPDGSGPVANGNGNSKRPNANGSNGHKSPSPDNHNGHHEDDEGGWACSDKQRDLILRIVRENHLDKNEVEAMAQQLFAVGVKECDKLQASQLIEDLLEKVGGKRRGEGSGRSNRWKSGTRS